MSSGTGVKTVQGSSSETFARHEKRLLAVEYDFKRLTESNKTINLLSTELERIDSEQVRYKKHLKGHQLILLNIVLWHTMNRIS